MPGTIKTTSLSAHHQAPIYQCVGVGAAGALAKSVQAAEARPIQMTVEHYRTHTRKLTATREELQQVAAPSVEPPADPFSQIWDSSFKAQDQQLEQLLSDRLPSAEKEHLLRVKNTNETIRLISAVLSNYAI